MSVINLGSDLQFKSSDFLFARIRKRLRSYDAAGILDEGDWYWYMKSLIDRLGVSVYAEQEAIIMVESFRGPMPDDFSFLYAAYKCTPNSLDSKASLFPQHGFVFYLDETHEPYRQCKNCASAKRDFVEGEKITIRTYIEGQPMILNFNNPFLLQLTPTAKGICHAKCKNLFQRAPYEISIDNGTLYTNFEKDAVYIKYFALAMDPETGLPLVPDNTYIEKAIEDYIIFRIFQDIWYNGEAPDIERRYQASKLEHEDSMKMALYWVKMPSFQNVISKIKFDRKNLRVYQQI